ncbi:uncharacterized protein LOC143244682 [Tachypleus tridentatus]|uniref:uncharacterized protein LOC143244682 n=1 Tax=Tachypleus tridentatus TaxID=6853 RepID=UPI003FD1C408
MNFLSLVILLLSLLLYGIALSQMFVASQTSAGAVFQPLLPQNSCHPLMADLIIKYQEFISAQVADSSNGTFCCFNVPTKMAMFTCNDCSAYSFYNLTRVATPYMSCSGNKSLIWNQLSLNNLTVKCKCVRPFFFRTLSAKITFQVSSLDIISETNVHFGCQENSTIFRMEIAGPTQTNITASDCNAFSCSLINIFIALSPFSFLPVFQDALDFFVTKTLQIQMNNMPFISLSQWLT